MAKPILVGSAVSLGLRVAGVALGYVVHIMLSRALGLSGYGQYVIALGWALVLTLPARLGFDNAALRYSAIYLETGNFGSFRGFVRLAATSILAASVAVALAMILVGGAVGTGTLFAALVWAAALIPPLGLLGFLSIVLRTANRIFASQFYDQVLRPALLILLIAAPLIAEIRLDAGNALMLTVVAALIALGAIALHFRSAFAFMRDARPQYGERWEWYGVGFPLLAITVAQELLNQLEVLLLGYLADAPTAGLFSAAWRLASLMPFALQALATVGAPMIAVAYHHGDQARMHEIARLNARLGLAFAAVAAIGLAIAGRWLLGIFGPEFETAYPALLILLIGGSMNAFTGLVAYFLTLTGRERPALLIFVAALALSLGLNLLLIPRLGVVGAAIASSSGLALWNLAMLVYVRRVIGIDASALGLSPVSRS